MPSPVFVVTNVGLANTFPNPANPSQVVIYITDFEVGTGFGQEATANDTGLFGNRVFGPTAPTTYAHIPEGGVDIVLTIPPDAGPFDYGEVAIYNTGPNGRTLFAHAVWDEPQTKYSSLETNVGSSEVFHALLRLQQATAVFKIDTLIDPTINTVDLWSDVVPPGIAMDPSTPLTRVLEADPIGDASLLINSNPNHWAVGTTYEPLFDTTIVNATTTSIDVPTAQFNANALSNVNRRYVIGFGPTGLFRSALNLVQQGGNYRFNLNPAPLPDIPAIGSAVRIYEAVSQRDNTIPLATVNTPGIVRPGAGIALPAPGVFETYGLLHGVPGAGRILNASDSLNSETLNSGEYSYFAGALPQVMPPGVTLGGRIRISKYEGFVVQQVFPQATHVGPMTPAEMQDPNNQMWWRIAWGNSPWQWSDWRNGYIPPPEGGGSLTLIGNGGRDYSGTFSANGETIMAFNSGSDPSIQGYINGNHVTGGDSDGGSEGLTLVGYKGASWQVTSAKAMTIWSMKY